MKIIDWNLSYAGDIKKECIFIKSLIKNITTFCIILQEVTESSYIYLKENMENVSILYSLNFRKPSKFDSKARRLGVVLIFSKDVTILDSGVVDRNLLPERTLYATINSGKELRILGIHSITGCGYKKAKSLQYDCLAEFITEYRPDFIGIDANEPQIDSDNILNMKFFDNGKGAATFFNEIKNIGLVDSFVKFNKEKKFDNTPLAVSHKIHGKTPVRYDFLFSNNDFEIKSFLYDYENAITNSSDHAILVCDV